MKKGMISIFSLLTGVGIGAVGVSRNLNKRIEQEHKMSDKHLALFQMMSRWVNIKQEGKSLVSYFEKKGFHEIAIYGMSYAGQTLVEELAGSSVCIKYGIDQRAETIYSEFEIISPDEKFENVDAVIVTAVTFFSEIEEKLSRKVKCPIISLEDILYDI